jgi:hypothetical protein
MLRIAKETLVTDPLPIEADLVRDFVANAHGDIDRVRALLAAQPALVNAAWDWGAGDWETGLGAAAHMGRHDIATLLLDHGARIDLFAAAMLGRLEVVEAVLATWPEALHVPGPHRIPLVEHARAGGAAAEPVLAFLERLGAGS